MRADLIQDQMEKYSSRRASPEILSFQEVVRRNQIKNKCNQSKVQWCMRHYVHNPKTRTSVACNGGKNSRLPRILV